MHLKNFSLIETAERSGENVLSPTYDLLPLNVIMPEDAEQTALALNGKKQNIRRPKIIFFRVMILIFLRSHDIKAPFNVAIIFLIRSNLLMSFFTADFDRFRRTV